MRWVNGHLQVFDKATGKWRWADDASLEHEARQRQAQVAGKVPFEIDLNRWQVKEQQ